MRCWSLLVLAVVLTLVAESPAGAHTEVQRATPGPGETVSGTVDWVVLDFLDPVLPTPEITVTGPDGQLVPGLVPARLIADDVAKVSFDPLTEAGSYQVDYTFAAIDGDQQSEAHTFSFRPDTGFDLELRPALVALFGAAVVAMLGWALLDRRRQTRLRAADHR